MNQSTAKKIRKIIYADQSQRTRNYGILQVPGVRGRITGQLVCRGLRERYQAAKRLYKGARRLGRSAAWVFQILTIEGQKLREAQHR